MILADRWKLTADSWSLCKKLTWWKTRGKLTS